MEQYLENLFYETKVATKEFDLLSLTIESEMKDSMNQMSIENLYMEDGKIIESIKNFFATLVKKISDLVQTVRNKIKEMKIKHKLDKIMKNKDVVESEGDFYSLNTKEIRAYWARFNKKVLEINKKIDSLHTSGTIEPSEKSKLLKEIDSDLNELSSILSKDKDDNRFLSKKKRKIKDQYKDVNDDKTIEDIQKSHKQTLSEIQSGPESAGPMKKTLGAKLTSGCNKTVNFISKNKVAIIASIAAVGVGVAAYKGGKKKGEREGYEKGNTAGYKKGYGIGKKHGSAGGFKAGKKEGYDQGAEIGTRTGFKGGVKMGYQLGEREGYEKGNTAGYKKGYGIGKKHGSAGGFKAGKQDGYEQGTKEKDEEIKEHKKKFNELRKQYNKLARSQEQLEDMNVSEKREHGRRFQRVFGDFRTLSQEDFINKYKDNFDTVDAILEDEKEAIKRRAERLMKNKKDTQNHRTNAQKQELKKYKNILKKGGTLDVRQQLRYDFINSLNESVEDELFDEFDAYVENVLETIYEPL